MSSNSESPDQRIVFFDGLCHLCSGFVDYLILHDPQHHLHFAPLQGETASKILDASEREGGSVIFWKNGKKFSHSNAALLCLAELGGVFLFAKIFLLLIPRFLRDFLYRWIASHRYAWFGKREFCRIPRPQEKEFLLP
jgi:predicted DCC family thiol-disulfide oxidoreductase YuxK